MVRARVSASVKSGKSVDNKKRVLSLAEQILQFVLSTDFTDFTDFCYASVGARRIGCADAIRVIRAISGSLIYFSSLF